jgi:hypothetical protein
VGRFPGKFTGTQACSADNEAAVEVTVDTDDAWWAQPANHRHAMDTHPKRRNII